MKRWKWRKIPAVVLSVSLIVPSFAGIQIPVIHKDINVYADAEAHTYGFEGERQEPYELRESKNPFEFPIRYTQGIDALAHKAEINTSIKYQGGHGVCWAFAAIADFEAAAMKLEGYSNNELDFSESHMRYAMSNDGNNQYGYDRAFSGGGNDIMSQAYFARGYMGGPALEKDDPYSDQDTVRDVSVTESVPRAGYCMISSNELGSLSGNADDEVRAAYIARIKREVFENGAVEVAYYSDDSYRQGSDGELYHYNTNSAANHDVTIVGWDDTKSAAEFSYKGKQPKGDGAWLIKNSWGTWWGDDGYFWMSYYSNISSTRSISEVDKDENIFENVYEYDYRGATINYWYDGKRHNSPTRFMYNKFTTNDDTGEKLSAISTYASNHDIYLRAFVSTTGNPADFKEVNVSNMGSKTEKGYYKEDKGYQLLELEQPVSIAGDYLVGVQYYDDSLHDDYWGYTVSIPYDSMTERTEGVSFSCQSVEDAKSGKDVADFAKEYGMACIKAFTTSKQEPVMTYTGPATVSPQFDYNDDNITYREAAQKLTVNVTSNPDGKNIAASKFSFSSSQSEYKKVEGITVSQVSENTSGVGNVVLTVKGLKNIGTDKLYLAYKGRVISTASGVITYDDTKRALVDTKVSNGSITEYMGYTSDFTAYADFGGVSASKIGDRLFKDNLNIKNVVIEDGYTAIGSEAFANCISLEKVIIPATVDNIAEDAFAGCTDNLLIQCERGSAAEALAQQKGLTYVYTGTGVCGDYVTIYAGQTINIDIVSSSIIIGGNKVDSYIRDRVSDEIDVKDVQWVLQTTAGKASSSAKIKNTLAAKVSKQTFSLNKIKGVRQVQIGAAKANGTKNNVIVVKALSLDGSKEYARVEVVIKPSAPESITIKENKKAGLLKQEDGTYALNMNAGSSVKLSSTISPKTVGNKQINYRVETDTNDVVVTNTGVVKANNPTSSPVKIVVYSEANNSDGTPCASAAVNVNVAPYVKSLTSSVKSLSVSSDKAQRFRVSTVPYSMVTVQSAVEYNSSAFILTDTDGNEIKSGSKVELTNGSREFGIRLLDSKAVGKNKKITFKCEKPSSANPNIKALSITLSAAGSYGNIKGFTQKNKKKNADGMVEINIPVGVPYQLGVTVSPANAYNEIIWSGTGVEKGEDGTSPLTMVNDMIYPDKTGTYTLKGTSVQTDASLNKLETYIYKVTVYKPTSYIGISSQDYCINGGYYMRKDTADYDCITSNAGGYGENVYTVRSDGSTEPIEWKSSKDKGLTVETQGEDVFVQSRRTPGTYTVTGTSLYTKQKYSYKVIVTEQLSQEDAENYQDSPEIYLENYDSVSGTWNKIGEDVIELPVGKKMEIRLVNNKISGTVKYAVSNKKSVTVSSSGVLNAVKDTGETVTVTITMVKSGKGAQPSVSRTMQVKAVPAVVTAKTSSLPAYAQAGSGFKVKASVSGVKSYTTEWHYKNVKEESDTGVLKLSSNKLQIDKAGVYEVYPVIYSKGNNKAVLATGTSKVIRIYDKLISKTSVSETTVYAEKNKEYTVSIDAYTKKYEEPDIDVVTWTTSNSNIVIPESVEGVTSCYEKVKLKTTGIEGKAVVTGVFANSGKKVKITVITGAHVTYGSKLTLNKNKDITMKKGTPKKLSVVSDKAKTTIPKSIRWTVTSEDGEEVKGTYIPESKGQIIAIGESGMIIPLKSGKVKVKAAFTYDDTSIESEEILITVK